MQTKVISFPGTNINQLAYKIDNIFLVKKVMILHVGTDNIEKIDTGAILSAFNNLNLSVRRKGDPMIVISNILLKITHHMGIG